MENSNVSAIDSTYHPQASKGDVLHSWPLQTYQRAYVKL